MHIILVDDNDEFCTVTAQLLSRAGHIVRATGTARDAVRLLREALADLLITDIIMPTEDGLALITKVQQQFPGVAIIGISGTSSHSTLYLKIASKLGAAVTLLKPFSVDELLVAIARIQRDRAT
jgi:two-component system nitrogen regulation response regulator GlnG